MRINQLLDDGDQPQVPHHHLQNLASIFSRYNVQSKFGLHLIYGHLKVERDMIMLGTTFAQPSGCWTKPTSIQDINPEDIHGHVFILSSDNRLVAYEYREGPSNNIAGTDPAFFQKLIEYLQKNALASVLGLQALHEGPSKQMVEIVLSDVDTIMLNASEAKYRDIYRVTGWYVGQKDKIVDFNSEKSYAQTTKSTYQVFVGGKALSDLAALKSLLKDEDII